MKRLDLIIDALEDALKDFATDSYGYDYRGCCGADLDVGHTADCKLAQALAVARELRKLKPVAWRVGSMNFYHLDVAAAQAHSKKQLLTPLYALGDEK